MENFLRTPITMAHVIGFYIGWLITDTLRGVL